jgi:serine/threonine protein kinase
MYSSIVGTYYLIGFTGAQMVDEQQLTPDTQINEKNSNYVAEEVKAGRIHSFSSDIFSLGATMYKLLTGTPTPTASVIESKISDKTFAKVCPFTLTLFLYLKCALRQIRNSSLLIIITFFPFRY